MPVIIKRQDARSQGLTRYFTGKPCAHGHITERMVSSGSCVTCCKSRKAEWEKRNPEKVSEAKRLWIERNPEKVLTIKRRHEEKNASQVTESKRAWRQRNPDKIKAKNASWLAANKDRMRDLNADWYRSNRDKASARDMRRRAGLQAASVDWGREFTSFVVSEAANVAAQREVITGFKWHIDHMVPIKCRKASGLHVWSNLQVIPALLNAKKLNRFVLTEPGEWIHAL